MTKKNLLLCIYTLLIMMILGSLFDYQISKTLYNPSSIIGLICAGYGQLPSMLCLSISGYLLTQIMETNSSLKRVVCYLLCFLLTVSSVIIIALDSIAYIEMPFIQAFLIALVIVVLVDIFMSRMILDISKQDLKKFMILLLGTVALSVVSINILKIVWERPRMRLIEAHPVIDFQPWWIVGGNTKEILVNLGVNIDEFKSFPSGHAGSAACLLVLNILPFISLKLKKREKVIFVLTSISVLVVGFSRVIYGAHFLSDIAVGMAMTLLIEYVLSRVLWKERYEEE